MRVGPDRCRGRPPGLAHLRHRAEPARRKSFTVRAGNDTMQLPRDPDGPPLARVFKTIADPFVGRISLMSVLSGTLRPDMTLVDSRSHSEEKLHALQIMRGKETQPTSPPRPATSSPWRN